MRTEAGRPGARVVGAAVAAARGGHGRAGELARDERHVGGQAGVDVILEHDGTSAGRVAGHVLVQEGQHVGTRGAVVAEDVGGAQQAALFAAVPVKLDGVLGREACVGEHAQGLEEVNGAGAVVVGARGAGGGRAGRRIEVSADNDWRCVSIHSVVHLSPGGASYTQVGGAARDASNHRRLVEGVGEAADGDGRVGTREGSDLVEEPGGGLRARGRAVVAVVVAARVSDGAQEAREILDSLGEGLQPALGVGVGDARDERVGLGDVGQRGRVLDLAGLDGRRLGRGREDGEDVLILVSC